MDFNRIFNVNFNQLATLLTPIFWRKQRFLDFIWSLVKPFVELKTSWNIFRDKSIYKVVHNGQVGLLEKVLNDEFDPEANRIYIIDSLVRDIVYLYRTAEARPVNLYRRNRNLPVRIYRRGNVGDIDVDFYVVVPMDLKPSAPLDITNFENRIKALVNYYKLASKRYRIIYE